MYRLYGAAYDVHSVRHGFVQIECSSTQQTTETNLSIKQKQFKIDTISLYRWFGVKKGLKWFLHAKCMEQMRPEHIHTHTHTPNNTIFIIRINRFVCFIPVSNVFANTQFNGAHREKPADCTRSEPDFCTNNVKFSRIFTTQHPHAWSISPNRFSSTKHIRNRLVRTTQTYEWILLFGQNKHCDEPTHYKYFMKTS